MDIETNSNMISRRDVLRRGAFVGGAVLWVAPAVQVIGMGRAFAKDVSGGCYRYCIKWEVDANLPPTNPSLTCTAGGASAYPIWGNAWTELGNPPQGTANALTCPGDGFNTLDQAEFITKGRKDREFVVYGSQTDGFWIAFPADVKLAYLADVNLYSVGAKCGQTRPTFTPTVEDDPCLEYPRDPEPNGVPFKRLHIPANCGSGQNGISHIELIVDWCQ